MVILLNNLDIKTTDGLKLPWHISLQDDICSQNFCRLVIQSKLDHNVMMIALSTDLKEHSNSQHLFHNEFIFVLRLP